MAIRDYSEEDDYYGQGFQKEGVVSIWAGLSGDEGDPELDVLQDLCGVGYYRLSDQEHYNFGFELVDLAKLLEPLSYSQSYMCEALAAASRHGLEKARWVTVQYDFDYDPSKIRRPIADDPVFIGSFPYCVQNIPQAKGLIEAFVEHRADGKQIHEGMDLVKLITDSGWDPQRITRISWTFEGKPFAMEFEHGVLAKLLPGRRRIALLELPADGVEARPRLVVINQFGQEQYAVSDVQTINGTQRQGEFAWFEPAVTNPEQYFGVVFETVGAVGVEQYRMDLKVGSGEVAAVYPMR
jgi:hypothetical protein